MILDPFKSRQWTGWIFRPAAVVWLVGLSVATGVHVVLLGVLVRHRLACPPCLVTGVGALVATGGAVASASVPVEAFLSLLATAVGAGVETVKVEIDPVKAR